MGNAVCLCCLAVCARHCAARWNARSAGRLSARGFGRTERPASVYLAAAGAFPACRCAQRQHLTATIQMSLSRLRAAFAVLPQEKGLLRRSMSEFLVRAGTCLLHKRSPPQNRLRGAGRPGRFGLEGRHFPDELFICRHCTTQSRLAQWPGGF